MPKKIVTPPSLQYIEGKSSVLLLAPHAQMHKRPNLTSSYKQPEPWTDYIVRNLAELTKSSALYSIADLEYDPAYHKIERNPFKQISADIVKNQNIKYVFDFHGLNDMHMFDLGVFYMRRFRNAKNVAYDFSREITHGKLNDVIISLFNFKDNDQETLVEYLVQNHRVTGLQIEIARYIREDDVLRELFIKNFAKFINGLV